MKTHYLLFALLLIPAVSAQGLNNAYFWEPFSEDNEFEDITVVVGDSSVDVASAIELSLALQAHAPKSHISAITHEQYVGNDAMIVTSGSVEDEFVSIFEQCGIDTNKYSRISTSCQTSAGNYYIVYAQNNVDGRNFAREIASGKVGSEVAVPVVAQKQTASVNMRQSATVIDLDKAPTVDAAQKSAPTAVRAVSWLNKITP